MSSLRRRREHNLDGQTQHIARPNRHAHFWIAPHMPDRKRLPSGRRTRCYNSRLALHQSLTPWQAMPYQSSVQITLLNTQNTRSRGRHTRKIRVEICNVNLWQNALRSGSKFALNPAHKHLRSE